MVDDKIYCKIDQCEILVTNGKIDEILIIIFSSFEYVKTMKMGEYWYCVIPIHIQCLE
jgi:hypothetical protein